MERHIILKIINILKTEIKSELSKIKDLKVQNKNIYELLVTYMPYIDKNEDNEYSIEIKRDTTFLDISFSIEDEYYIISIVIY